MAHDRKDEIVVLNQFSHFGNPLWHYCVTARAMEEVFRNMNEKSAKKNMRFSGLFLTQGSAGTLSGTSHYLRETFPLIKVHLN